ncbi:MAG: cysteine--tRNA ligase [Nitrospirota bacterium]
MLRVYNTLSGEKEDFRPLNDARVGIYACGVTVYDHSHLGHARGAVIFDVVRKYLRHKGFSVTYARNFTDVDDKIIKRAAETGMTWKEVAEKYTDEYIKDMQKLGVDRPDLEPRATDYIPEIVNLVKTLVDKGYAYASGDDVFFSVRKFPGYGKLSKKPLDDMMAGARVDVNEQKNDPLDFVLWKKSKPGEPSWDSPWGPGRPGWHIECSAMSTKLLGDTFDIHGGGMDLTFPHHENEIAQAEAATGKPFVKYWMHNGFVNINREKMSKSLGNFFTIKEILDKYEPEAVRLFLLSTHYRNPIDFSDQSLKDSKAAIDRYYTMMEGLEEAIGKDYPPRPVKSDELSPAVREFYGKIATFKERFEEAMDDDFNTASAIGAVFELVREINRITTDKALLNRGAYIRDVLAEARDALKEASKILNLFMVEPGEWFRGERLSITLPSFEISITGGPNEALSSEQIQSLIDGRNAARASKDWKKADEIRDKLAQAGVELLDGPEGTKWRRK